MTEPTQGLPVDRTVPVDVPSAPSGRPAPLGWPSAAEQSERPTGWPVAPAPAGTIPTSTTPTSTTAVGPAAGTSGPAPAPTPTPTPTPAPAPARHRPERRRGPGRLGPVVAVAAVAGLLGGLGGGVLAGQLTGPEETPAPVAPDVQARPASVERPAPPQVDGSIPALSRAVLPSVALISVGVDGGDGLGSGFVIREDGYLLTNAHVIADAGARTQITVELPGEEPLPAEVVGSDTAYDIAVLKVDRTGLPALPFVDSEGVEVGQTVVAVGAPLGLDSSVTSGIVSALDRPVVAGEASSVSYINAIQTDAAINPGNSGGPLLDLDGYVVGVNSALAQLPSGSFGRPAGSIGLGFAIPAAQAEHTANQLIETGRSEHPVMGVHIDLQYTGDGARVLPFSREGSPPVIPGGPAEAAGVQPGDVIVSVDGVRIRDSQHLLVLLRSYRVGDVAEMTLRSPDGAERTVSMALAGSGG